MPNDPILDGTGDRSSLAAVTAAVQARGMAFALMTAHGSRSEQPFVVPGPNHWIARLGNIQADPQQVSLDLYSGSQQQHLVVDRARCHR
jgi:hypothetical protein